MITYLTMFGSAFLAATILPAQVPANALDDYTWIVSRMSVGRK